MKFCYLVIGGMSSGKSSWSLNYISRYVQKSNQDCSIIVTADNTDIQFNKKIAVHKVERLCIEKLHSIKFNVIESPQFLAEELMSVRNNEPCLIDSLDLWINNILYIHDDKDIDWIWNKYCSKLISVVNKKTNSMLFVSTEVGHGVIPIHKTSIKFIELLGKLHQAIAQKSSKVFYIIAGRPICMANEVDYDFLNSEYLGTVNTN